MHAQNQHNAEILERLEGLIIEKEAEISRLRESITEKDLQLQAQQCDFRMQLDLVSKQNAQQDVTNTLQQM